jgi:transposase-like protein
MMARRRRTYSPEFKFKVAMEFLTRQKRRLDIVREYEISDSTLERWCEQVRERGPRVFAADDQSQVAEQARRIAELERVIGRLTVELEAAKKASTWLRSR